MMPLHAAWDAARAIALREARVTDVLATADPFEGRRPLPPCCRRGWPVSRHWSIWAGHCRPPP